MSKDRPLGIKLLSILSIFSGVSILLLTFSGLSQPPAFTDEIFPWWLVLISITFIGLLDLGAGIGMLLGKTWGWWVASFNFLYAIARSVNAIYTLIINDQSFEMASRYYVKYGGRIIIIIIVLVYLFRPKILQYFDLGEKSVKYLCGVLFLALLLVIIPVSVYMALS